MLIEFVSSKDPPQPLILTVCVPLTLLILVHEQRHLLIGSCFPAAGVPVVFGVLTCDTMEQVRNIQCDGWFKSRHDRLSLRSQHIIGYQSEGCAGGLS